MTTLARGSKITPRSKGKSKPKKPAGRVTRAQYAGYETWLQFRDAYGLYLDEFSKNEDRSAYTQWLDGGIMGAYAFHQDAQNLNLEIAFSRLSTPRFIPAPEDASSRFPPHLYALDVVDLVDFTSEDVLQAWDYRAQSCGSQEAAAELLALYRVLNGDDEFYAGWITYLYHPDVLAIFNQVAEEGATTQAVMVDLEVLVAPDPIIETRHEPTEIALLRLAEIPDLTTDQLKSAWANRPDSFASLEAAAETLAILRSLNSTQPMKPTFRLMMDHELVRELEDSLSHEIQATTPSPTTELAMLKVDRRTVRTQVTVIRPGQGNFRATMLARYGGECCISGCRVDTLLEAAHIIPYRGDQSDDATNGLLLRVDLHRLFDAHLVTINPATLQVEVDRSVEDTGYQAFHGKRMFLYSPKPRVLFLESHYQAFKGASKRRH
ncbi:HNH endonuclease [Pseudomonas sp. MF6754]|uniref:HNH endonuclease n=1 Tax=Pseudomonas sp. MF6754 TaxID=2797529 RepID=UPI001F3A5DB0|nr:HNH endonuclease [Pseudomonas sp. MF6754]